VDTPRYRALASASRAGILRLVRASAAGLTTGEVAASCGLHVSTVRAHLDRLTEAGLLVRERAGAGVPGRPAWRYRSAAPEPAPGPYRALAAALLEHLSRGGEGAVAATRVGEDWGRRLAAAGPGGQPPVDELLRVLDRLGFAPRPAGDPGPGGTEIRLHACPFLELVAGHAEAMCGLHLGVIRGALAESGVPVDELRAVLEPFGAPDACVVRLPGLGPDPATPAGSRRPLGAPR
jgi:predicted ArsR family transcriptional regulator